MPLGISFQGQDPASLLRKPVDARGLSSAEWSRVSGDVANSAFFSSKVSDAKLLAKMQGYIARAAEGESGYTRGDFIKSMQSAVGVKSSETWRSHGKLTEITSSRRLGLIYDFQAERLSGEIFSAQADDPEVASLFPALELIRNRRSRVPRDWKARWRSAGGKLYQGRMVALREDPIWRKISRFGSPIPPFDFNSGMGVEEVSRFEAEDLGLIKKAELEAPVEIDEDGGDRENGVMQARFDDNDSIDNPAYHRDVVKSLDRAVVSQIKDRMDQLAIQRWTEKDFNALIYSDRLNLFLANNHFYTDGSPIPDEARRQAKAFLKKSTMVGVNGSDEAVALDRALSSARLPVGIQTQRTGAVRNIAANFGLPENMDSIVGFFESRIGRRIGSENFFATSIGKGVFKKDWEIKLVFDLPKSANAAYIQRFNKFRKENEVLISRAQKFIPTKIIKDTDGRVVIHLLAVI